jgi:hypothetical protein
LRPCACEDNVQSRRPVDRAAPAIAAGSQGDAYFANLNTQAF